MFIYIIIVIIIIIVILLLSIDSKKNISGKGKKKKRDKDEFFSTTVFEQSKYPTEKRMMVINNNCDEERQEIDRLNVQLQQLQQQNDQQLQQLQQAQQQNDQQLQQLQQAQQQNDQLQQAQQQNDQLQQLQQLQQPNDQQNDIKNLINNKKKEQQDRYVERLKNYNELNNDINKYENTLKNKIKDQLIIFLNMNNKIDFFKQRKEIREKESKGVFYNCTSRWIRYNKRITSLTFLLNIFTNNLSGVKKETYNKQKSSIIDNYENIKNGVILYNKCLEDIYSFPFLLSISNEFENYIKFYDTFFKNTTIFMDIIKSDNIKIIMLEAIKCIEIINKILIENDEEKKKIENDNNEIKNKCNELKIEYKNEFMLSELDSIDNFSNNIISNLINLNKKIRDELNNRLKSESLNMINNNPDTSLLDISIFKEINTKVLELQEKEILLKPQSSPPPPLPPPPPPSQTQLLKKTKVNDYEYNFEKSNFENNMNMIQIKNFAEYSKFNNTILMDIQLYKKNALTNFSILFNSFEDINKNITQKIKIAKKLFSKINTFLIFLEMNKLIFYNDNIKFEIKNNTLNNNKKKLDEIFDFSKIEEYTFSNNEDLTVYSIIDELIKYDDIPDDKKKIINDYYAISYDIDDTKKNINVVKKIEEYFKNTLNLENHIYGEKDVDIDNFNIKVENNKYNTFINNYINYYVFICEYEELYDILKCLIEMFKILNN